MTAVLSEPGARPWWRLRELWASASITVMWVAVLFDAVFGADFKVVSNDGSVTTIPSAIAIALFAAFASKWVARAFMDD